MAAAIGRATRSSASKFDPSSGPRPRADRCGSSTSGSDGSGGQRADVGIGIDRCRVEERAHGGGTPTRGHHGATAVAQVGREDVEVGGVEVVVDEHHGHDSRGIGVQPVGGEVRRRADRREQAAQARQPGVIEQEGASAIVMSRTFYTYESLKRMFQQSPRCRTRKVTPWPPLLVRSRPPPPARSPATTRRGCTRRCSRPSPGPTPATRWPTGPTPGPSGPSVRSTTSSAWRRPSCSRGAARAPTSSACSACSRPTRRSSAPRPRTSTSTSAARPSGSPAASSSRSRPRTASCGPSRSRSTPTCSATSTTSSPGGVDHAVHRDGHALHGRRDRALVDVAHATA